MRCFLVSLHPSPSHFFARQRSQSACPSSSHAVESGGASQNGVSAREREERRVEDMRVKREVSESEMFFRRRRFHLSLFLFFRERKETGVQKRCSCFFLASVSSRPERERETARALTARSRAPRGPRREAAEFSLLSEGTSLAASRKTFGQRF